MEPLDLVRKAIIAREASYSPYSNFKVGATVLLKDGKTFNGTNIENASYGLCMCAERNALYQATIAGYKKSDIIGLAVVADTDKPVSPCGACRQVISELMLPSTPIYLATTKSPKDFKVTNGKELLPFAFEGSDFKK